MHKKISILPPCAGSNSNEISISTGQRMIRDFFARVRFVRRTIISHGQLNPLEA
jgi:hypothetical protein